MDIYPTAMDFTWFTMIFSSGDKHTDLTWVFNTANFLDGIITVFAVRWQNDNHLGSKCAN